MRPAPARPWTRLAMLTALVLTAHLAVLEGGWRTFTPTRDRWARHFTTRTVVVAPPAPPAAATPPVPPAPAPEPKPAPAPAPAGAGREPVAASPASPPAPAPAPAAPAPQRPPARASGEATPFTPTTLALPQPAVLRYQVTVERNGLRLDGEARLDWWHDGTHYDLKLELEAPGGPRRQQHSAGTITDEGLAPQRFSDKSRSEQATHFDRARGRVVFSNNRPEAALAEGMQDRLSVVVQLTMLVSGDPARFPPGTQIAIPTASARETQDWVFRVEGEEELALPGGALRALKLQRLPAREFDQKIELWLAPGKDYAPVRLRLTNPDGGTVDQRWASTDRR